MTFSLTTQQKVMKTYNTPYVIMLIVDMLSFAMLKVAILNVALLSVATPSVTMPSVPASTNYLLLRHLTVKPIFRL